MTDLQRRSFLKGGLALGAAAIAGPGLMRLTHAADAGPLILYNGQHRHTTQALIDAFTEATGIKVEHRKGKSAQLANQIIEEGSRSPADVFYAEESAPIAALAQRDMLDVLPADVLAQVDSRYSARDGSWAGISARSRVTVYNPDLVAATTLPGSVLDMATPAWEGRVGFVPTSGAFQEQIIAIKLLKGRDAALAWLQGLKRYGSIYGSNMAAMRAVEAGDIATALVNSYYWFIVAREKGAAQMRSRLHYSAPGDAGALLTVSAAGILKSSRNKVAARALLAYMVSAAGQEVIAGTVAEYPLRPGLSSPFEQAPWNLIPLKRLAPPAVTPADMGDAADAVALRREAGLA